MELYTPIIEAMLLLVLLISAALMLRAAGALTEEHADVFSRVITLLVLPALVFNHLSAHPISADMLQAPTMLFISGLILMVLAWSVGTRVLHLGRLQLGALILCTGFGAATLVGIPLVEIAHPELDLQESILIGVLGVELPLFILGPLIASYYGRREGFSLGAGALLILRSPIVLAAIAGILWGQFGLPRDGNLALGTLFLTLDHLEAALLPLVGLAIGLMIRPIAVHNLLPLFAFVAAVQLVLQPVLLAIGSWLWSLPASIIATLILQGAAPVTALSAIFVRQYGCDGALAASLILFTTLLSLITIPLMVIAFG
ncbi:AEC family transporter [Thiocapsa imhoffii]|nr:AEC family transporter [Thiocapsa imhoffii]